MDITQRLISELVEIKNRVKDLEARVRNCNSIPVQSCCEPLRASTLEDFGTIIGQPEEVEKSEIITNISNDPTVDCNIVSPPLDANNWWKRFENMPIGYSD